MTQKAYMLVLNSEEELGSLIEWLREHPDDGDMKADGLDPALRPLLDAFLRSVEESHDQIPFYVPVPLDLAPLLEWVMDDWGEVLASHNERSRPSCYLWRAENPFSQAPI